MIDDVKAAFKQRLVDAEWMDAGTKHAALVKLEAITDMIGYPDYIKVRSVFRSIIRQPCHTHTYTYIWRSQNPPKFSISKQPSSTQ